MSREKQIEEMARDICRVKQSCNDVCHPINSCRALKYAERFYDAGYRKQEWISVDERLPDNSNQILIYLDNGIIEVGYYDTDNKKFYHFLPMPEVVYWMPLPEAPKMKGGE